MNNKGFSISSLLYPAFILIITITITIIVIIMQTSYQNEKLTYELSGDLTENNTMKSLKYNVEAASKEASVTKIVYNANDGIISGGLFENNINTTNWNGRIYTTDNGDNLAYIDNGTYCAYLLPGMSGVAVYNTGDCIKRMSDYSGIDDLVCPILDGDATAEDVSSGKTFYSNDGKTKLTGTNENTNAAANNEIIVAVGAGATARVPGYNFFLAAYGNTSNSYVTWVAASNAWKVLKACTLDIYVYTSGGLLPGSDISQVWYTLRKNSTNVFTETAHYYTSTTHNVVTFNVDDTFQVQLYTNSHGVGASSASMAAYLK